MWRRWSFEVTTQKPGYETSTTAYPGTFLARAGAEGRAYRAVALIESDPHMGDFTITYRVFRIGER
jgi:hypothetical protein